MDPYGPDETMDPRIYRALKKADIFSLKMLLQENPSRLHGLTAQKNTALHIAAGLDYNWSVPEIHQIFDSHLYFQFVANKRGETPLHCAARAGKIFMVNFLIGSARKSDGQIHLHEMKNERGDTPLHEAARNGHLRIAYELMKADEALGEEINNQGESAVFLAAERGAEEIVRMLLQFPSSAVEGPKRQTALHAAVCRNYGNFNRSPFAGVTQKY